MHTQPIGQMKAEMTIASYRSVPPATPSRSKPIRPGQIPKCNLEELRVRKNDRFAEPAYRLNLTVLQREMASRGPFARAEIMLGVAVKRLKL